MVMVAVNLFAGIAELSKNLEMASHMFCRDNPATVFIDTKVHIYNNIIKYTILFSLCGLAGFSSFTHDRLPHNITGMAQWDP